MNLDLEVHCSEFRADVYNGLKTDVLSCERYEKVKNGERILSLSFSLYVMKKFGVSKNFYYF